MTWYEREEMKMLDDPDYYPKTFRDENDQRYEYCEKCDIEITRGIRHCDEC